MTSKKKADLQRKLTLAQVPKPPADLAERIKRDIPPHLVMGAGASDHNRFTRSIFFDMRVAASVLLVVTSAFFALQFFSSHADRDKLAQLEPRMSRPMPVTQTATLTAERANTAGAPVQVARLEPIAAPPLPPAIPAVRTERAKQRRDIPAPQPLMVETAVQETTAMGAPAESFGYAAPPPPAPAPAAPAAMAAEASVVAGGAGRFMAEAKAADMVSLSKRPDAVFGISVDDHAFERIKTAIERGEQPESASIDVAALVNYFAGSAKRETHDVRLEAEGSPAPVVSQPGRRMIRVTIDTATIELAPGASVPPVATSSLTRR